MDGKKDPLRRGCISEDVFTNKLEFTVDQLVETADPEQFGYWFGELAALLNKSREEKLTRAEILMPREVARRTERLTGLRLTACDKEFRGFERAYRDFWVALQERGLDLRLVPEDHRRK